MCALICFRKLFKLPENYCLRRVQSLDVIETSNNYFLLGWWWRWREDTSYYSFTHDSPKYKKVPSSSSSSLSVVALLRIRIISLYSISFFRFRFGGGGMNPLLPPYTAYSVDSDWLEIFGCDGKSIAPLGNTTTARSLFPFLLIIFRFEMDNNNYYYCYNYNNTQQ